MAQDHELSTAWTFDRRGGGLIDEYIVESEEYLGIGSGSFSYLNGTLYVNTFSLDAYRASIAAHRWPVTGSAPFCPHRPDALPLYDGSLRPAAGQTQVSDPFGLPVELALPLETAFFAAAGAYAENSAECITLTPRGRYLLVIMMREFFSSINRVRDQARQSLGESSVESPGQVLAKSKLEAEAARQFLPDPPGGSSPAGPPWC